MSTFSDDFERPDGGLGNNWVSDNQTATISGGKVQTAIGSTWHNQNVVATGRQEAIAVLTMASPLVPATGPMLKSSGANRDFYTAYCTGTTASPLWVIRKATAAVLTTLVSLGGPAITSGSHTVRFLYDGGILSLWYDGYFLGACSDSTWGNNTGGGFYANSAQLILDSITILSDETVSLSVSPTAIPNFGSPTELTFTGVGTSWTAGTPGSPTLACSAGSLSDQQVLSTTSATATYTPGNFLGTVTFTDPSTGATCTATVSSDIALIPPDQLCQFDEFFVALANRSGHNSSSDELITTATAMPSNPIFPNGDTIWSFLVEWAKAQHGSSAVTPSQDGILNDILRYLIDGQEITPGENVFSFAKSAAADALAAHTSLDDLRYPDDQTLAGVIESIKGADGPTLQELELQIGIAGQVEYADLLAAIAAVKGDPLATINAAIQQIFAIRTAGNYDLQDVLDAIAAIGPGGSTDLTPVLHKLDHIQPDEFNTLSSLASAQAVELAAIVALAVAFAKFITPAEFTVTSILDTITNGNQAIIDEIRKIKAPPHWPGHANVTFGAPHDLATTTLVEGPMHGVLIEITATEPGTSFMQYDGVKAWRHVGGLAFYTDDGQMETYQALGFATAVYVPKTMSIAQGCKLFKSHLPRGTITPWTISS